MNKEKEITVKEIADRFSGKDRIEFIEREKNFERLSSFILWNLIANEESLNEIDRAAIIQVLVYRSAASELMYTLLKNEKDEPDPDLEDSEDMSHLLGFAIDVIGDGIMFEGVEEEERKERREQLHNIRRAYEARRREKKESSDEDDVPKKILLNTVGKAKMA